MDGCYRSSPRPGRSRDLDASSSLMTGLGGALSPITVYLQWTASCESFLASCFLFSSRHPQ